MLVSRAALLRTQNLATTNKRRVTQHPRISRQQLRFKNTSAKQSVVLDTQLELGCLPCTATDEVLAMGSLKAPPVVEGAERAPIDVVAVTDVSWSMVDKLHMVKKSCEFLAKQLKEGDSLSLVSYNNLVSVDMPLTQMSDVAKAKAQRVIDSWRYDETTNLSGGLLSGIDQIAKSKSGNKVTSVLLFTDGHANEGITIPNEIMKATKSEMGRVKTPVSIHTFGYGEGHDSSLLMNIAETGSGTYYFVKNVDDIALSFGDAFGGLLSVCAQNIKLSVKPIGGAQVTTVMGNLKMVADENSGEQTIDLGDLYHEENRDVVFGMRLPTSEEGVFPICELKMSYFNVISCKTETSTIICNAKRSQTVPANQQRSIEMDKQINRLKATQAMKVAQELANAHNFSQAESGLKTAIAELKSSVSSEDPMCLALIEDMHDLCTRLQPVTWEASIGETVSMMSTHVKQRASARAGNAYQTTLKRGGQRELIEYVGDK